MRLLLLVLLMPLSTQAFEVFNFGSHNFTWPDENISYRVHGPRKLKKAAKIATKKWSAVSSGELNFYSDKHEPKVDIDIFWVTEWPYTDWYRDALAVAMVDDADWDTGDLLHVSIYINADTYRWRRGKSKIKRREMHYNLDSTVLHELGHAIGIFHSDRQDSVMYPSTWNTVLSDDDIAAVRYLYLNE